MKKYQLCLLVFSLCLLLSFAFLLLVPNAVFAGDDSDWEFWNDYSVAWGVTENWQAKVTAQLKFQDDMSDYYYYHIDGGLSRKLTEWFKLSFNYRYIESDSSSGWNYENRPHVTGQFYWQWGTFSFSDQNRFEYRDREASENTWRYRNKLTMKPPLKWTEYDIQPYAAGEALYSTKISSWNQYRLTAGFDSKPADLFIINLYYMFMSTEKSDGWSDTNVLGLILNLVF